MRIRKRTGTIADFDQKRITTAILKAVLSTPQISVSDGFPEQISSKVMDHLMYDFQGGEKVPTVEQVQDIVERTLVESGNFEIAKHYILYREDRARDRSRLRFEELRKLEKNLLNVVKNSGKTEVFDMSKVEKVFNRAAKGFEKTCKFKDLLVIFKNLIVDKMTTQEIMKNLRKVCIDMITSENVSWQYIAGRLYAFEFYTSAGRNRSLKINDIYTAKSYKSLFDDYIKEGLYYKDFYKYYSEEDILEAGNHIDKDRDMDYVYSTLLAFDKRYLLNPNKYMRELPQEMYMSVALFLAIPEPKETRLSFAKQIYDVTSTQKLSLPTPTLLNSRTNHHQLSSCFKLNINDDLRAIYHGIENMAQISKFGGGVGVYMGHVRSKASAIRGVKGSSGGVIPWVRVINDTACAVNQLGSRLGAISPTLDVWHRDIEDFLHMQTETGDIRSKAFDVFPAISIPDIFMERVEEDREWTLFDPHEIFIVTGKRMEDFFDKEFSEFYEACEQNKEITLRETIGARVLMKEILKTTVETGMPYFFFRDTVNRVNPNNHAGNIYSTQLCTEICQNTSDSVFKSEDVDENDVTLRYKTGDTVVCNLASINVAKVNTDAEIDAVFPVAMRLLDNVITLNYYPIREAEVTAKAYRSVGLGFMGLAEYLACNKYAYDSKEARDVTDELFEKYAYAALDNSCSLAKERGEYDYFRGSRWEKGEFFGRKKDWYLKHSKKGKQWETLMSKVKKDGLRFAYHLAPAPNTSTAGVVGTTAGLLPVYKKFFVETNVIAPTVTVAPGLNKENFWFYKEYVNMDMHDVIDMFSVVYKWIDQSASFEWMINPATTSPADLYGYYMKAWKSGIKTVYYLRSLSGDAQSKSCESCSG